MKIRYLVLLTTFVGFCSCSSISPTIDQGETIMLYVNGGQITKVKSSHKDQYIRYQESHNNDKMIFYYDKTKNSFIIEVTCRDPFNENNELANLKSLK